MPRSFEQWFSEQRVEAQPVEQSASPMEVIQGTIEEFDMPEGLWWNANGVLSYNCRSCGGVFEWNEDPQDFTQDMAYCGGSPWCLP